VRPMRCVRGRWSRKIAISRQAIEITPMSMSLRDQLLAAGLGSKQQAKKARDEEHRDRQRQQHQQRRPQAGGAPAPGGRPAAPQAQRADAEKRARDLELERKKRDKAERKERAAAVRQIIEQHALPALESDDRYNFVHDGRIARIAVDAARRAALIAGTLAVARTHGRYFVVPADSLEKIRERDPRAVVAHNAPQAVAAAPDSAAGTAATGDEDPYARYEVPDDLMW
jgi:uncharacterized protein YaiL (DUF2058 family)